MNLRGKKKEKEQSIIDLWKKRIDICEERKAKSKEVEDYNLQTAKLLSDLITPICKKTNFPLVISIYDNHVDVYVKFYYPTRKIVISPKVTFTLPSINYILSNKNNIDNVMNSLEKQLRFLKKAFSSSSIKSLDKHNYTDNYNTLLTVGQREAKVEFNTRTRYV